MKRWQFVLDDGTALEVLARDFRSACTNLDGFGIDPRSILEVRSWES